MVEAEEEEDSHDDGYDRFVGFFFFFRVVGRLAFPVVAVIYMRFMGWWPLR